MKGGGRNVGWSNQTWFRADTLLLMNELQGLADVYPQVSIATDDTSAVSMQEAINLIGQIAAHEGLKTDVAAQTNDIWREYKWGEVDLTKPVSRAEMAVLIDKILDPFHRKEIDIHGSYTNK